MIDFEKAERQLLGAFERTTAEQRKEMLRLFEDVLYLLKAEKVPKAQRAMTAFTMHAWRAFQWDSSSGERMPRPFNNAALERLFWQAHKQVWGWGQPRRVRKKPAQDHWDSPRY